MKKRTAISRVMMILLFSILIGGCGKNSNPASDASFDVSAIESSSDAAYTILNDNQPSFQEKDFTEEAFEIYSELDALGRCQTAFANICKELMPEEERGSIGSVKPTGWQTVKYDIVEGKYLYNRCHLIGYQLAGENANEKNLITGTRYMNVEGMLPFENMVADFVEETDYHVLYRVTPVFEGDNLVASGVEMEAESVEDKGEGICFHVFVYNIQPDITIDYATGESSQTEDYDGSQEKQDIKVAAGKSSLTKDYGKTQKDQNEEVAQGEEISQSDSNNEEITYILNTNTKKFHLPGCSSVKDMKESNKKEHTGSREKVLQEGYDPCKRCKP